MGKVKHKGISWEQFIVAWQRSDSREEVGRKLGLPVPLTRIDYSWLAQRYRKALNKGVKLKKYARKNGSGESG